MNEDIGTLEADLEALMAALELAGTVADRARRDALRLARYVHQHPPRSRKDWANRAQLQDPDGRELGWLDTSKATRIDLSDGSGAGDRNVPKQPPAATTPEPQGPGQLMEVEGQFFEVRPGEGKGNPDRVRPITQEEAQARLAEHRPDLTTRLVGEADPRLEVTRAAEVSEPRQAPAQAAPEPQPTGPTTAQPTMAEPRAPETTRAERAGVVAIEDAWERASSAHDGVVLGDPELSREQAAAVLAQSGAKDRNVRVELHRRDDTVHVKDNDGVTLSSQGAAHVLGISGERARALIGDAGQALREGAEAYTAREDPAQGSVASSSAGSSVEERTSTHDSVPGRSAAEAFGGHTGPVALPRRHESQPAPGAPSTAELTAVSAPRSAGVGASR